MKLSYRTSILFSGCLWLVVGVFLLSKGLGFVILAEKEGILKSLSLFIGSQEKAALFVISSALLVGFIKGRFILSKTVKRIVTRIYGLPSPVVLKDLYPKSYYLLLGAMVLLGFVMRWLPIGAGVRGFIDIAIGSALINGAILYFKAAFFPVKTI